MQELIERIAKIEEAAERIKTQADQEKKRIEAEYRARMSEADRVSETELKRTLEEFEREQREKTETELNRQSRETAEQIAQIARKYEEAHEAFCDRITERILTL